MNVDNALDNEPPSVPTDLRAQLTKEEATEYLNDRQSSGYILVLANLIEHTFASRAPANLYNVAPFTQAGNFNTPTSRTSRMQTG